MHSTACYSTLIVWWFVPQNTQKWLNVSECSDLLLAEGSCDQRSTLRRLSPPVFSSNPPPLSWSHPEVQTQRYTKSKHDTPRLWCLLARIHTHVQCLRRHRQTAPLIQWSLALIWPADIRPANRMHCALAWQYSEERNRWQSLHILNLRSTS